MQDAGFHDVFMTDEQLREIFQETKIIAAVGLSSNPNRPSHGVCAFLQSKGYRIIPVNPNETEVLGEKSYPDLMSIPEKIDVVQIFRKPEFALALVEDTIEIGAKVVWMQDGAGKSEAVKRAEEAGIFVVNNDCMLRQYQRLMK